MLMTNFIKGHLVDPLQAVPYRALTQLRRQLGRTSELRPVMRDVWEARRRLPDSQVEGPGKRLIAAANAADWDWTGPTTFTPKTGNASTLDVLTIEAAEWGHIARDALRRQQLREAQLRRAKYHNDMGGIEHGVNHDATRALWNHPSTSAYQRRFLVTIVTGGSLPARRLHEMKLVDSPHCPFCSTKSAPVVETPEHVTWGCPAWETVRRAHPFSPTTMKTIKDSLNLYHKGTPGHWPACTPELWPPCLLVNGIIPTNFDATRHLNPDAPPDKAAPRRRRLPPAASTKQRAPLPTISDKLGPPLPADDSIRDSHPRREAWHEGRKIIFVDGGCDLNGNPSLSRAGYGCYWAPGHPLNAGLPLDEHNKTNNTAELRAAIYAIESDPDPLEIRQDSSHVVDGVNGNLARWRKFDFRPTLRATAEIANHALWRRLDAALRAHQQPVTFVWVKGHTSADQVAAREASQFNHAGNNAADDLATTGIQARPDNKREAANIVNQTLLALQVQRLMLNIAIARDKAMEAAGMKKPGAPPPKPKEAAAAAAAVVAPGAAAAAAPPPAPDVLDLYPFNWKPKSKIEQDQVKPTLRKQFKIVYKDATDYNPTRGAKPVKPSPHWKPAEVFCPAGPTLLQAAVWYVGQLRFPRATDDEPWAARGVSWNELAFDFELATGLDLPMEQQNMQTPEAIKKWGNPRCLRDGLCNGGQRAHRKAQAFEAWVRAGIEGSQRPTYARPIDARARALKTIFYTIQGLATRQIAPGKQFNSADALKRGESEAQVSQGMRHLGARQRGGAASTTFYGWTRRPLWVAAEKTDACLRKYAFAMAASPDNTTDHEPDYKPFDAYRHQARAMWREPPSFCDIPTLKISNSELWPMFGPPPPAPAPRPEFGARGAKLDRREYVREWRLAQKRKKTGDPNAQLLSWGGKKDRPGQPIATLAAAAAAAAAPAAAAAAAPAAAAAAAPQSRRSELPPKRQRLGSSISQVASSAQAPQKQVAPAPRRPDAIPTHTAAKRRRRSGPPEDAPT
eukprot:gene57824-biopygen10037